MLHNIYINFSAQNNSMYNDKRTIAEEDDWETVRKLDLTGQSQKVCYVATMIGDLLAFVYILCIAISEIALCKCRKTTCIKKIL